MSPANLSKTLPNIQRVAGCQCDPAQKREGHTNKQLFYLFTLIVHVHSCHQMYCHSRIRGFLVAGASEFSLKYSLNSSTIRSNFLSSGFFRRALSTFNTIRPLNFLFRRALKLSSMLPQKL